MSTGRRDWTAQYGEQPAIELFKLLIEIPLELEPNEEEILFRRPWNCP
jgi:hypothetical protein